MMAVNLSAICLLLLAGLTLGSAKEKIALIIMGVQKCRLPGGSLGVAGADAVIPVINDIRANYEDSFDKVAITVDWHCANSISLVAANPGHAPFSTIDLKYNKQGDLCQSPEITAPYAVPCTDYKYDVVQTIFPDHCVRDTPDAEFHPDLVKKPTDIVVKRGNYCHLDSYSAFYDRGDIMETGLHDELKAGINTVIFTGTLLDYDIIRSAKDALELGYKVVIVLDATYSWGECTRTYAIKQMQSEYPEIILVDSIEDYLGTPPAK